MGWVKLLCFGDEEISVGKEQAGFLPFFPSLRLSPRRIPRLCSLPRQEKRDCGLRNTVSQNLCSLTFIEMASLVLQAEAVLEPHWLNRRFFNDNIKKQELFIHGIVPGASGRFTTNSSFWKLTMQDRGRDGY